MGRTVRVSDGIRMGRGHATGLLRLDELGQGGGRRGVALPIAAHNRPACGVGAARDRSESSRDATEHSLYAVKKPGLP